MGASSNNYTVSYPSGKILQVAYGVDGKPTSLTYDGQTVLDQATWTAFDAAKSWRWGAAGLSVGQKQVNFDGFGMTLGYDVTGRLVQTTRTPSSTTQAYNAMGQRVRKTTTGSGAGTLLYAYDEGGRMLGAYKVDAMAPGGFTTQEELVSFDGWRIVATVRPDASLGMSSPVIYPVLSDHLGTPRKVLDPVSGFTRWDWDAKEPFGMQAPNENPASAGVFKLDARFPGQRFDAETGLYHNGFRDYHAGLGRYAQSDPLGLEAGWNTYAYVGGAPMGAADPFGLIQEGSFVPDAGALPVEQCAKRTLPRGYCAKLVAGTMLTDKGRRFRVHKRVEGFDGFTRNCHGFAMDQQYWIENDGAAIVYADEYHVVSKPKTGDLIAYTWIDGVILHSSTFVGIGGYSLLNYGKSGPASPRFNPESGYPEAKGWRKTYYRRNGVP